MAVYIESYNPLYLLSAPVNKVKSIFNFFSPPSIETSLAGRVSKDPAYRCNPLEVEALEKLAEKDNLNGLLDHFHAGQLEAFIDKNQTEQRELKDLAINSVLQAKGYALFHEVFHEGTHFFHHLIEIFISVTGFNEIGSGSHHHHSAQMGSWEAKAKLELYTSLIGYPAVIFAALYAYLGAVALTAILTAAVIMGTIVAIGVYVRFLRPCPRDCIGMINLTEEVLRSSEEMYMRKDIQHQIQDAFRLKKGVLLVGEPGCGKNSIVNAFARKLALHQFEESDVVKKAQIFSVNGSNISGSTYSYDGASFNAISARFKNYPKEVIFFIDEIHSLFKDNQFGDLSDTLKTFCDQFPFVIGATTTQEYNEHFEGQEAVKRRFVVIQVGALSDIELKSALYKCAVDQAPEAILDKGVIDAVMEKGAHKIHLARPLLMSAISKMRTISFPELEHSISQLETRLEHMQMALYVEGRSFESDYQALHAELLQKKQELKAKRMEVDQIQALEKLFVNKRVAAIRASGKGKRAWLKASVVEQLLQQAIQKRKVAIGLPPMLDASLI